MTTAIRVALALFAIVVSSSASAEEPALATLVKRLDLVSYRPGTTPPEFAGVTLDDRHVTLTQLRGKVVIVNFWASWCLECRPEMPGFERLHRDFAQRGLAVVGINAREDRSAAARFAAETGVTFPLVLDADGANSARYGIVGLPATFVIARDGRAVGLAIGPRAWGGGAARALIERLLAESAPRVP